MQREAINILKKICAPSWLYSQDSCSRLRVVYVIQEKEMIVQATLLWTGWVTDTSCILIHLYWNLASTYNNARVTDLLSKYFIIIIINFKKIFRLETLLIFKPIGLPRNGSSVCCVIIRISHIWHVENCSRIPSWTYFTVKIKIVYLHNKVRRFGDGLWILFRFRQRDFVLLGRLIKDIFHQYTINIFVHGTQENLRKMAFMFLKFSFWQWTISVYNNYNN
jgi:hypothetical protein